MRKLSLFVFLLFLAIGGYAQQEAQYTQFMYNKLSLNPAYAGSSEALCISCIHRTQWIGFDGAPSSQVLNFHMPMFKKRVGVGASIAHDKIGPIDSYTASLMYAYRVQMKKGKLALGVRGTMRSFRINWAGLATTHPNDEDIPTQNTNRVVPNFGVGAYYNMDRFYVGLSVPNLINNDLSYTHLTNATDFGRVRRHAYLMTGYLIDVSDVVKFKPAALLKYVSNAPLDLDINATFIFMNKLWTGLSYRMGGDSVKGLGESIDLLVQYQISPAIRAGLSYDFTLSKLKDHSSGSIEVQLEYCLQPEKSKRLTNPRFF